MNKLTNEQKAYELSLIWCDAKYNFAFWDYLSYKLNWDKEYEKTLSRVLKTKSTYDYYRELQKFVSLLNDGHSYVLMPEEMEYDKRYGAVLPVFFAFVENKVIINNCFPSVASKIKLFSEVKKINGLPTLEYFQKFLYPYIWHSRVDSSFHRAIDILIKGKVNSKVTLELEYEGKTYTTTLKRQMKTEKWFYKPKGVYLFKGKDKRVRPGFKIEITEDDIALITVDTFNDMYLEDYLKEDFDFLKQAKGYIINLDNNHGGSTNECIALASLFIKGTFKAYNYKVALNNSLYMGLGETRKVYEYGFKELKIQYSNPQLMEKAHDTFYHRYFQSVEETRDSIFQETLEGPIVIMASDRTASAAEDFINILRYNTNCVVVGTRTAGSSGMPLRRKLPSGGTSSICTKHNFTLTGEEFTGVGIKPDYEVGFTIESLKKGEYLSLKKSLEVIRELLKNK